MLNLDRRAVTRQQPYQGRRLSPTALEAYRRAMASDDAASRYVVEDVEREFGEKARTWGHGRLWHLLGNAERAKFERQIGKWDDALISGDLDRIKAIGEGTIRGLRYLDKQARAAQCPEWPVRYIEVVLADGTSAAIVADEADTAHIPAGALVFTAAEIAAMIDDLEPTVLALKRQLPGAYVSGIRKLVRGGASGQPFDDSIPF